MFRMSELEWEKVMAQFPSEVPSARWGGWLQNKVVAQLFIPYWMLVLSALVVDAVPWVKRYSLRTLLIATTLVAVVLGLIVWMSQTS